MRIRLIFSKTDAMRFTGHLDLQRAWERTFRRARLPLAYSQGFNPRPKINLASALPLGFTGAHEVVEVRLERVLPIREILPCLESALPPGLKISSIELVDPKEPSLQSQVIASDYTITLLDDFPELAERVIELLESDSLPRERRSKSYDLRPLIEELRILEANEQGHQRLFVRLSARPGATGRPEELLEVLGYDPTAARVERDQIVFQGWESGAG